MPRNSSHRAPSDSPPPAALPPIRRPVLFYATACVAFGLLGAAVIALGMVS